MTSLALRSFAGLGYDATSLRQIAGEAGVDVALVARLYGSKQALWKAVVDRLSQQMAEAHHEIHALLNRELAARDKLAAGLWLYVESHARVPELFRFFANEVVQDSGRRAYVITRLWQPHCDAFLPLLQDAMEAGVLPRQDSELLLLVLAGAVGLPMTLLLPKSGEGAQPAQLADVLLALCGDVTTAPEMSRP